jgi:hypothetical protein
MQHGTHEMAKGAYCNRTCQNTAGLTTTIIAIATPLRQFSTKGELDVRTSDDADAADELPSEASGALPATSSSQRICSHLCVQDSDAALWLGKQYTAEFSSLHRRQVSGIAMKKLACKNC